MKKILDKIPLEILHYGILLQAGIAMAGSLFFSQVMNLPPCELCWYERIAMYPIAILATVGLIRDDKNFYYYVLALSLPGLAVSLYHNLLYWKILPESAAPCILGVSCTTQFFEWFGFITIPFMALTAFTIITTLSVMSLKKSRYEKS